MAKSSKKATKVRTVKVGRRNKKVVSHKDFLANWKKHKEYKRSLGACIKSVLSDEDFCKAHELEARVLRACKKNQKLYKKLVDIVRTTSKGYCEYYTVQAVRKYLPGLILMTQRDEISVARGSDMVDAEYKKAQDAKKLRQQAKKANDKKAA